MRLVQTMDPVLAPSLPVQIGTAGNSACLQIDVLSGAQRNPQSNFESTTIFLGSDPECDFILSGDYFPPMYAFLLVDSQGAVIRHLGGGPPLLLDTNLIERQRITTTAKITAGPLAIALQVTPSLFQEDHSQKLHRHQDMDRITLGNDMLGTETSIQLIEQASRLLASIGGRETDEVPPITMDQKSTNACDHSATRLNITIGRPATGQLPPIWHHICLN